jgi:hypothetical protein
MGRGDLPTPPLRVPLRGGDLHARDYCATDLKDRVSSAIFPKKSPPRRGAQRAGWVTTFAVTNQPRMLRRFQLSTFNYLSFFLIRIAAVPPTNVPIIVNGSGTAVELETSGANANAKGPESPVAKAVLPVPSGLNLKILPER